ncbi:MAG: trimethylamine methyltransferase family protein [Aliidongia sp.]
MGVLALGRDHGRRQFHHACGRLARRWAVGLVREDRARCRPVADGRRVPGARRGRRHDTLALDAVREVGPGKHYFGAAHTQSRYRDAFYAPILSDWRNFETWAEAGSPTAIEKANRVWKDVLAGYEKPPLDPAIEEELDAFVAKRKSEGGFKTDF